MAAIKTRYGTIDGWKKWATDNTTYFTNAEGTSLDDVIGQCMDAGSRGIDSDCGRGFYRETGVVRTYRVEDNGRIAVVDLISDSIVEVLYDNDGDDTPETALAVTDYLLWPLTDHHGRTPERYQGLRRRAGASVWPATGVFVSIEADWGYVNEDGEPPADVIMACFIRAGRLFARREAKLGAVSVPGMGTVGMIKGQDQDYLDLIRPYIRTEAVPGYAVT